jgi:hypothetical protein
LPYIRRGAWGKKWKQVEHETTIVQLLSQQHKKIL